MNQKHARSVAVTISLCVYLSVMSDIYFFLPISDILILSNFYFIYRDVLLDVPGYAVRTSYSVCSHQCCLMTSSRAAELLLFKFTREFEELITTKFVRFFF